MLTSKSYFLGLFCLNQFKFIYRGHTGLQRRQAIYIIIFLYAILMLLALSY